MESNRMTDKKDPNSKIVGVLAEEAAEVVEEAIHHAPSKDVGFFLKAIAIAIIILAIGYAISMVFEGDRSISYERENGSTITITKEDPESIMDAGE